MEMLLLNAACCSAVDLVMILKKGRQTVVDDWVEIGGAARSECRTSRRLSVSNRLDCSQDANLPSVPKLGG